MKKLALFLLLGLICSNVYAFNGRKAVTAAGTAEALVSHNSRYTQVTICAETDNTGVIAVGNSGVIASLSTRTGIPLDASDCYTLGVSGSSGEELRTIYIDSTVSGDGVTFQYV